MPNDLEAVLPYRWDLLTPAQLGTLRPDQPTDNIWYLPELIVCVAKVVARSGGGDLYFVGRSLDSMFDLLSGAFEDTDHRDRLGRLPLSFAVADGGRPSYTHILRAQRILTDLGLSPHQLARRSRPVAFVDVVYGGGTFSKLFSLLYTWIRRERESWPVIRQKLRFVGVTERGKSSPKTWRWQQHARWPGLLPARSVVNVSLDRWVWSYLADQQSKLTPTFAVESWLDESIGPRHDDRVRLALREALALVASGRSRETRRKLGRLMAAEPAIAEPWLRALVAQLSSR